jgi:hypothetical protein
MSRLFLTFTPAVVLVVAVAFTAAQTPPKEADKPAAEKTSRDRIRETQKKLNAPVDYGGMDDVKATFDEVLTELAKIHGILFDVNERAFEEEGVKDVLRVPVVPDGKPLPAMKGVTLDHLLRKILTRIPVQSGATYINRGDSIEIMTGLHRAAELHLDPSRYGQLPVVTANIAKQPLEGALKELVKESGFNIVLDVRAKEKADANVAGDFANVPLDTAVRILADMADLKPVLLDNVLYVTTKENAKALQEEYQQRRQPEGGM